MKFYLFFILFLIFFNNFLSGKESNLEEFEGTKVNIILGKKNNKALEVGLKFSIEKNWKIYWIYPGDSGLPPKLRLLGTSAYQTIIPSWPFPKEEFDEDAGLISRIYTGEIVIPYQILLKQNKKHDKSIKFELDYQVCKDICIPVKNNFVLDVPEQDYINDQNMNIIEKYKKRVPIQLTNDVDINSSIEKISNKKILISFYNQSIKENEKNTFKVILYNKDLPSFRTSKIIEKSKKLEVELESTEQFEINNNKTLVFFETNQGFYFMKSVIKNSKNRNIKENKTVYFILIMALLAGFILNFMPCVLPVLGIKINNLIKQSETRNKHLVKLSSFYVSVGIVSTFLFFSLIVTLFRSLGLNFGWGMQFQSPFFLIVLIILLILFTVISFDFIKINFLQKYMNIASLTTLTNKSSLFVSNFSTGVLSTLLATPCTAPLVGSAISLALSQSYIFSFFIFLLMGLGKAFPYLIFIFKPTILWYLPKPGIWTKYIKVFVGIMLLISIFWLGTLLLAHFMKIEKNSLSASTTNIWEDFSIEKLKAYRKNNRNVFIDVTAEWCINCKMNKKLVLDNKEVQKLFKENNIVLLRADWTFPDERILNFLKEHKRYGIPFNIYFSEQFKDGYIFSEILTKTKLFNVLHN